MTTWTFPKFSILSDHGRLNRLLENSNHGREVGAMRAWWKIVPALVYIEKAFLSGREVLQVLAQSGIISIIRAPNVCGKNCDGLAIDLRRQQPKIVLL